MKRVFSAFLAFVLILTLFFGCAKTPSQEAVSRTESVRSQIESAKAGATGAARQEKLEELGLQLEEASAKLENGGSNLSEEEISAINSTIDEIEKNVNEIVSGEKSESDLLMDKYTRVANLYSSIASEFVGTPEITNGSFSSIGFEITDIATALIKGEESLTSEEYDKISAQLDTIEEKLENIKATAKK